MAVVTRTRNGAVKLAFGFSGFRQIAFSTFVEHPHKGTDNFQMAQFFCGDVHQHLFTRRIFITQPLGEIAGSCGEFALWATKLFQQ